MPSQSNQSPKTSVAKCSNAPITGVLFDLDGTLADTAPDLVHALNLALVDHQLPQVAYDDVRHSASHGSLAMVEAAQPKLTDEEKASIQQGLLTHYRQHLGHASRLFDGIETLLDELDRRHIPYGIVTNKQAQFCRPLMHVMGLTPRLMSIISGDSTAHPKPHTAPMLLAAQQIDCQVENILYLGDAERDLVAARAANMQGGIALWGYIGEKDNPDAWPYDFQLHQPSDVISLLDTQVQS